MPLPATVAAPNLSAVARRVPVLEYVAAAVVVAAASVAGAHPAAAVAVAGAYPAVAVVTGAVGRAAAAA